jgi:16S rRNA (cytidine1402-2'-O)-methyltransferase
LLIVATPIGNLDDLSPRAAAALRDADLIACEDTRRTATLLRHAGATTQMLPVHEHNEAARAADLVRRIREGATVAMVSDAGMPGISDPGARVVAAAVRAGVEVSVIPGPSAVETALVASGLPVEPYAFIGFFPRKPGERAALLRRFAAWPGSVVGFESPRRLGALLEAIAASGPDRPVAVCREMTKIHEEVTRGPVRELADRFGQPVRGEITVVIGPGAVQADVEALGEHVRVLLAAGLSPGQAADVVAALGLGPRNAAYRAALASRADR